jgi:hypothetical protein
MSNTQVGYFGDARRAERGASIFERIVSTGSLVLRTIGGGRAGEVAVNRFLKSPDVTWEEILDTVSARTAERCVGRRIVAIQDTTDVNFSGRDRGRRALGPGSDGAGLGFFIHPVIAVDLEDESVIGLLGARIWTREADGGAACQSRRQRSLDEKESERWLEAAEIAAKRASGASQLIVVGDRENDIYSVMARRPQGVDLVIRAAQDRAVEDGGRLFAQAAGWPCLGVRQVTVPARGPGVPERIAQVGLRAGSLRVKRPRNGADPRDPEGLELTLVEVCEHAPPPGVIPIHWRLLTTLPVPDLATADGIVQIYRLRWRIEQTFRAVKSDGLGLPDAQVQEAGRLFKLAALGLAAAIRTIQLVDARDGSSRSATDVASPQVIAAAAAIGPTLEGKTDRQKNRYPPGSLAWLAWIIARLGGWNCYYKPPGPKTMRAGWDRFAAMAAGYHVAITTLPVP